MGVKVSDPPVFHNLVNLETIVVVPLHGLRSGRVMVLFLTRREGICGSLEVIEHIIHIFQLTLMERQSNSISYSMFDCSSVALMLDPVVLFLTHNFFTSSTIFGVTP
jgi:hypothetical protein